MAAVTHGVITYSEANATSYTSGAFTPATDDLLVGMVVAVGTGVGSTTFSTSDGEAFDQIVEDATDNYLFVGTTLAAPNSQTATFDTPSDSATRCGIAVARISGMTLTGSAAVRQTKTSSGNDATTPAATFDAAPLSGSVILAFLQVTSNTSPVIAPPSGFTEGAEAVAATENGALEYAYKDSGGPTTVTWGSGVAAGASWVATIVELKPDPIAYSIGLDAASFAVSGTAVSLEFGREVAVNAASIAVTAQAVSLELSREIAVAAGSFAVSGQAVSLEYGYEIIAGAASFSVSGQSVSIERGLKVGATTAAFAVSAQSVSLEYGYEIIAEAASFAVSEQPTSLEYGRQMDAETAAFSLSGSNATFVYEPIAGYLIFAETTSFAFSGYDVALERGREIAVDAASFGYDGTTAGLLYGRQMDAGEASFGYSASILTIQLGTVPSDPSTRFDKRKPGHWIAERRFNEGGFRPLRK